MQTYEELITKNIVQEHWLTHAHIDDLLYNHFSIHKILYGFMYIYGCVGISYSRRRAIFSHVSTQEN